VRNGTVPPPSRHPKLADRTLIAHQDLKFPAVPGVQWPTSVPGGFRADVATPYSALPFLVPAIDADGNDIGGIRLPEQAVPLATMTGWQFRSEQIGMPNLLLAMAGAYIPLPGTVAERERKHDPRRSIAERYPNRAAYLKMVQQSATRLAEARLLLQQDVRPIVDEAGQHWDMLVKTGTSR
jgi:Alpha/beta hydrolase domain